MYVIYVWGEIVEAQHIAAMDRVEDKMFAIQQHIRESARNYATDAMNASTKAAELLIDPPSSQ